MRSQGIGLAMVRIAFGAYFLLSAYQKTAQGWLASGQPMAESLGRRVPQSEAFYRPFLEDTVLANADLFSRLFTLGEWGVGISLVFGALTAFGAVVGAFLMANIILMKGFGGLIGDTDWLFFFAFVALAVGAAGMTLGVDGALFRRRSTRVATTPALAPAMPPGTLERPAVTETTTIPVSRRTVTRAGDTA